MTHNYTVPEFDPHKLSFEFGRLCPGLNFAKPAIYISIAQILVVVNIDKRVES
jgi:hypothetical protein